jgi:DNA-binding response OmpR family regulator
VLIDIGLPDASGCDIARSLREFPNGSRMRLVALTGYSDSATRKLAADAGFDDFFVKPFSSENLAHLLNH